MKKPFTLLIALATSSFCYAWDYLGQKGTGNGEDFEISSTGEIYVADYDPGLSGTNILLKVKKYNGTSWQDLPEAYNSGGIIATSVDIELNGSDVYVGYAEFKNSVYSIIVKKLVNNTWTQVGTSLQMPTGGASSFDLIVDADGTCYVLGAAGVPNSLDAKVHKFVGTSWTAFTIPNSLRPLFTDHSSYIDQNKDLFFVWSKTAFVGGALAYQITVNKLSGSTMTTVGNTVTTANGGTYNRLRMLPNETMQLVTSDNSKNTFYNLDAGTWNEDPITTTIGINTNADIDKNGMWYFANSSKVFEEGNATAIYDATSGVVIADLKVYDGNIYILLSDGVIKQDLSGATGLNDFQNWKGQNEIYPNPTTSQLNIQSNEQFTDYFIYHTTGSFIENGKISNNFIFVENLQTGVYHLQLQGANGIVMKEFVKQ